MNRGRIAPEKRPGYGTIKAIQDKRVLYIDEKLVSSPTFRYLEGVQEIARFLYP
jgi:iron complex transport system substrate-binding protein